MTPAQPVMRIYVCFVHQLFQSTILINVFHFKVTDLKWVLFIHDFHIQVLDTKIDIIIICFCPNISLFGILKIHNRILCASTVSGPDSWAMMTTNMRWLRHFT